MLTDGAAQGNVTLPNAAVTVVAAGGSQVVPIIASPPGVGTGA